MIGQRVAIRTWSAAARGFRSASDCSETELVSEEARDWLINHVRLEKCGFNKASGSFVHLRPDTGVGDRAMPRLSIYGCFIGALGVFASMCTAKATPNCLHDIKPYGLAGDTMEWSMTIMPGADCIQGLRWSTMQIYSVSVAEKPKSGELVLVGPGFRYYAKPDFKGVDSFTLVVVGKNRHDAGASTVRVTISKAEAPLVVSAVNHPE